MTRFMPLLTLKKSMLRLGVSLSAATDQSDLVGFLNSVKPVQTERELIRLGGDSDGGYLIPDDLEGITACFSPGVSNVASFETDLARRGIKSFLADYSVDSPPCSNELFDFEKKYLGSTCDGVYITLEHWMTEKKVEGGEMILQMDIEGGEYAVIHQCSSQTLRRFRIIIIEFHGMVDLLDKRGFKLLKLTFEKILQDFEVVHIHPNNTQLPVRYGNILIPPVMEFTFHRKDRIHKTSPAKSFPHPLDRPNVKENIDISLPPVWY